MSYVCQQKNEANREVCGKNQKGSQPSRLCQPSSHLRDVGREMKVNDTRCVTWHLVDVASLTATWFLVTARGLENLPCTMAGRTWKVHGMLTPQDLYPQTFSWICYINRGSGTWIHFGNHISDPDTMKADFNSGGGLHVELFIKLVRYLSTSLHQPSHLRHRC